MCGRLNIVADEVTLADALAHVEPEEHLGADQSVQPRIAHGQVLPGAVLGATDQLAESLADGRDVTGLRRRQLDGGVLEERLELGAALDQQSCTQWRRNGTSISIAVAVVIGMVSVCLLCNECAILRLRKV